MLYLCRTFSITEDGCKLSESTSQLAKFRCLVDDQTVRTVHTPQQREAAELYVDLESSKKRRPGAFQGTEVGTTLSSLDA